MTNRFWQRAAVAAFFLAVACSPAPGDLEARSGDAAQAAPRTDRIEHLVPARDSVGAAPKKFAWTPAGGEVRYEMGVWNEVDTMLWQTRDLRETSIATPAELVFEPGTYWWGVIAVRDGRVVAESGRSAFVVRQ
jgi:hypothetical protein